jgi:TetR/AcrR family transcriptional regulator, cholesterol catabolism regulator
MAARPPTRPALRERYERRQDTVIKIAARLFAERGYNETSIDELAESTGIQVGGLYHYIGSKEQLLVRIVDDMLEPMLERAERIAQNDESPAVQLRTFLREWLKHIASHQDHVIVFNQQRYLIEHKRQWRRQLRGRQRFEELLDGILARCESAGDATFGDRRLALLALLGMVNHTAQWLRPRGRLTVEQIADGYCDLILGRVDTDHTLTISDVSRGRVSVADEQGRERRRRGHS